MWAAGRNGNPNRSSSRSSLTRAIVAESRSAPSPILPQVVVGEAEVDAGRHPERQVAGLVGRLERAPPDRRGALVLADLAEVVREVGADPRGAPRIAEALGQLFRLAQGVDHPAELAQRQQSAPEIQPQIDGQRLRGGALHDVLQGRSAALVK